MKRSLLWVAAFALVASACTSDSEPATELEQLGPGRLVVVDSGGDIVVMDPDGANRVALTDDAQDAALYSQPIWSPDGTSVAWGQVNSDGFAVGFQMIDDPEPSTVPTGNLPIYLYWSPDSANIALLHPGEDGLDFEVVDVEAVSGSTLDRGAPFYFSWSPTSEEVITHIGDDRFETIKPSGGRERAGPTAAGYLAPQWTPAGVFHVDDDGLVVAADGETSLVAEVGEFTSFVANRLGTKVALQTTGGAGAVSVSLVEVAAVPDEAVVVVDVATGDVEVVSSDLALGFFWSPNGESLLVLTPTGTGMQATVWDTEGGAVDYSEFRPSLVLVREMFPFFPQYAQSLNYWSPDSTAFTYASDEGIFIQELGSDEPTLVSDGVWVDWSN